MTNISKRKKKKKTELNQDKIQECHAVHRLLNQIILFTFKTARKIYFAEYIVQDVLFYGYICDKQEMLASLYFKMCGESLNLVWFSNFSDKDL